MTQISATSPDQLTGQFSSDPLRLEHVSASPVKGGQQPTLISIPDNQGSSVCQPLVIPAVPGIPLDSTLEDGDPTSMVGGGCRQLMFSAAPNQPGLGQWMEKLATTFVSQLPCASRKRLPANSKAPPKSIIQWKLTEILSARRC